MRDCENCVYAKPFGGPNDNRCCAWSCEYINRAEAIEIYKRFKWRPISEKPETEGEYIITKLDYRDEPYTTSAYFGVAFDSGHKDVFYVTDSEWGDTELDDVIAWMPLPAPWKGETDGKDKM